MKVLLVSPLPPPAGGIATWTIEYLKYCKKMKNSVSLVNTALLTKNHESSVKKRNLFNEIKRTLKIVLDVNDKVKKYCPDVVHINSSCSKGGMLRDLLCVYISKRNKRKVLLHFHCNVKDMLGKSRISKYIFERLVHNSDCIVNLNKESFKFSQIIAGDKKCLLIPNFITIKDESIHRTYTSKISRCIYVGHVKREKGILDILELAKKLPHIVFEIIGPVSEEISRCFIPDNVLLYGAMENKKVMEYLKRADIYIFPSYSEGFSLSMLEAMSVGLPIIATNVGANQEMIEDKGGIIVSPGNVEELYAAINKLSCSCVREEMSKWNCEKVKNNYTTEVVLSKMQSIYYDLISN